MHDHNQDMIMAVAAGTLDDAAAAAAQAEIAQCVDCTRDLELQRVALSALADTAEVYLTAAESSRLHANLKQELIGIKPATAPRPSSFAWGRWFTGVAGAAAMFLVVFMVLPNVMGGSDDDGTEFVEVAADLSDGAAGEESAAPPTVAATEAIEPEVLQSGGDAADDAASFAGSTETTAAPAAATTTTAAEATATTKSPVGLADILPTLGFGELTSEMRGGVIEGLISDPDTIRDRSTLAMPIASDNSECSTQVADELGIPADSEALLVGMLTNELGEELPVIAYVPAVVNETVLVVVTYPECTVVQTMP